MKTTLVLLLLACAASTTYGQMYPSCRMTNSEVERWATTSQTKSQSQSPTQTQSQSPTKTQSMPPTATPLPGEWEECLDIHWHHYSVMGVENVELALGGSGKTITLHSWVRWPFGSEDESEADLVPAPAVVDLAEDPVDVEDETIRKYKEFCWDTDEPAGVHVEIHYGLFKKRSVEAASGCIRTKFHMPIHRILICPIEPPPPTDDFECVTVHKYDTSVFGVEGATVQLGEAGEIVFTEWERKHHHDGETLEADDAEGFKKYSGFCWATTVNAGVDLTIGYGSGRSKTQSGASGCIDTSEGYSWFTYTLKVIEICPFDDSPPPTPSPSPTKTQSQSQSPTKTQSQSPTKTQSMSPTATPLPGVWEECLDIHWHHYSVMGVENVELALGDSRKTITLHSWVRWPFGSEDESEADLVPPPAVVDLAEDPVDVEDETIRKYKEFCWDTDEPAGVHVEIHYGLFKKRSVEAASGCIRTKFHMPIHRILICPIEPPPPTDDFECVNVHKYDTSVFGVEGATVQLGEAGEIVFTEWERKHHHDGETLEADDAEGFKKYSGFCWATTVNAGVDLTIGYGSGRSKTQSGASGCIDTSEGYSWFTYTLKVIEICPFDDSPPPAPTAAPTAAPTDDFDCVDIGHYDGVFGVEGATVQLGDAGEIEFKDWEEYDDFAAAGARRRSGSDDDGYSGFCFTTTVGAGVTVTIKYSSGKSKTATGVSGCLDTSEGYGKGYPIREIEVCPADGAPPPPTDDFDCEELNHYSGVFGVEGATVQLGDAGEIEFKDWEEYDDFAAAGARRRSGSDDDGYSGFCWTTTVGAGVIVTISYKGDRTRAQSGASGCIDTSEGYGKEYAIEEIEICPVEQVTTTITHWAEYDAEDLPNRLYFPCPMTNISGDERSTYYCSTVYAVYGNPSCEPILDDGIDTGLIRCNQTSTDDNCVQNVAKGVATACQTQFPYDPLCYANVSNAGLLMGATDECPHVVNKRVMVEYQCCIFETDPKGNEPYCYEMDLYSKDDIAAFTSSRGVYVATAVALTVAVAAIVSIGAAAYILRRRGYLGGGAATAAAPGEHPYTNLEI